MSSASVERKEVIGLHRITQKRLRDLCKKDKLYQTPELNDVLYLHYQGFQYIECLEEYTELKCLWMECNAISEIQGLEKQNKLKCLFLQNNLIKRIENLEHCPQLDTLNLASNHIRVVENCGIDVLPVLNTLNLSSNYLRDSESLRGLEKCKTLSVLDLSNNRIDDILVVKVFAKMPQLRVLVLQGNPVVSKLPQYRKTLILECKELTYLDSRPVFPKDRACAEAWKLGGYTEERKEHERWNRRERKKIRDSVNATIRMRNRHKKDGEQLDLLTSSDSETESSKNRGSKILVETEEDADMQLDIWNEVSDPAVPVVTDLYTEESANIREDKIGALPSTKETLKVDNIEEINISNNEAATNQEKLEASDRVNMASILRMIETPADETADLPELVQDNELAAPTTNRPLIEEIDADHVNKITEVMSTSEDIMERPETISKLQLDGTETKNIEVVVKVDKADLPELVQDNEFAAPTRKRLVIEEINADHVNKITEAISTSEDTMERPEKITKVQLDETETKNIEVVLKVDKVVSKDNESESESQQLISTQELETEDNMSMEDSEQSEGDSGSEISETKSVIAVENPKVQAEVDVESLSSTSVSSESEDEAAKQECNETANAICDVVMNSLGDHERSEPERRVYLQIETVDNTAENYEPEAEIQKMLDLLPPDEAEARLQRFEQNVEQRPEEIIRTTEQVEYERKCKEVNRQVVKDFEELTQKMDAFIGELQLKKQKESELEEQQPLGALIMETEDNLDNSHETVENEIVIPKDFVSKMKIVQKLVKTVEVVFSDRKADDDVQFNVVAEGEEAKDALIDTQIDKEEKMIVEMTTAKQMLIDELEPQIAIEKGLIKNVIESVNNTSEQLITVKTGLELSEVNNSELENFDNSLLDDPTADMKKLNEQHNESDIVLNQTGLTIYETNSSEPDSAKVEADFVVAEMPSWEVDEKLELNKCVEAEDNANNESQLDVVVAFDGDIADKTRIKEPAVSDEMEETLKLQPDLEPKAADARDNGGIDVVREVTCNYTPTEKASQHEKKMVSKGIRTQALTPILIEEISLNPEVNNGNENNATKWTVKERTVGDEVEIQSRVISTPASHPNTPRQFEPNLDKIHASGDHTGIIPIELAETSPEIERVPDNPSWRACEQEAAELRALLRKLELQNEQLCSVRQACYEFYNTKSDEEEKYKDIESTEQKNETNADVVDNVLIEIVDQVFENGEQSKKLDEKQLDEGKLDKEKLDNEKVDEEQQENLQQIVVQKPKNYPIPDFESDEEYSYSGPPKPEEPHVKSIQSVLGAFNNFINEIGQKNREERQRELDEQARQRIAASEAEKLKSLQTLLKTPSLLEHHKQPHDSLEAQLAAVRSRNTDELKKLVDRVYAQKEKYDDSLELVDGKLMIVKKETGAIEEIPAQKSIYGADSSDESDTDSYKTAPSVNDDDMCRTARNSSIKRRWDLHMGGVVPHTWTPVYRPTMRKSAEELIMTALKENEAAAGKNDDCDGDDDDENFHSFDTAGSNTSIYSNIDEEFFTKLDFQKIASESAQDDNFVECARSYEELKHYMKPGAREEANCHFTDDEKHIVERLEIQDDEIKKADDAFKSELTEEEDILMHKLVERAKEAEAVKVELEDQQQQATSSLKKREIIKYDFLEYDDDNCSAEEKCELLQCSAANIHRGGNTKAYFMLKGLKTTDTLSSNLGERRFSKDLGEFTEPLECDFNNVALEDDEEKLISALKAYNKKLTEHAELLKVEKRNVVCNEIGIQCILNDVGAIPKEMVTAPIQGEVDLTTQVLENTELSRKDENEPLNTSIASDQTIINVDDSEGL